jgi:RimJ/RimL family protein N-acetyltransferase
MIKESPITTNRLILRTLVEKDASQEYFDWLNDVDTTRYLEVRFSPPKDLATLSEFIHSINESDNTLLFGIFLKGDDSRHIGNIKVGPISYEHGRADLGFLIGNKNDCGNGYATEAVKAIIQYLVLELKLVKIIAGCYESNVGSARVLEKVGFVKDAQLDSHWLCEGYRENGIMYSIISLDFELFIK